jgi:hypothetical protein
MDLKKSKVTSKLSNRQELLLGRLKLFYNSENMAKLLPIINGETKLSLRIIDWFVTNYTKKKNIILYNKKKKLIHNYKSPKNKLESKTKKSKYEYVDDQFNIFLNYKGQLKAYSKKNFDPFCRRERINFYYTEDKFMTTTVGQLNFFKWAIENNIINYIKDHLEKIDKDMNTNIKRDEDMGKKSKKAQHKKNVSSNVELKSVDLDCEADTCESNNDNESIGSCESIGSYESIGSCESIGHKKIGESNEVKKRRKRRELSCSANNNLNKHKFSITLEFE